MKVSELQKILEGLAISQVAFARELCVSEATVSRWLHREQVITPAMEKHIRQTASAMEERRDEA